MEHYTNEQVILLLKLNLENNERLTETVRKLDSVRVTTSFEKLFYIRIELVDT